MAVKIRLRRVGAKKKPIYHLVAADARMPRDGRCIEEFGYYDPRKEPSEIKIDKEKAIKWLARGAQPTQTAEKLLRIAGIREDFEANKKKYIQEVLS